MTSCFSFVAVGGGQGGAHGNSTRVEGAAGREGVQGRDLDWVRRATNCMVVKPSSSIRWTHFYSICVYCLNGTHSSAKTHM